MDGLYLLDGLQAANLPGDVVRVLTDTKDPGWAHVVAVGGTFSWESWTLSDVEGDGMSHGWGSSALLAFQTSILGVTSEPAAATPAGPVVDVSAPSAGPALVSGTVPTIAGPVTVKWQRNGTHLTLDLAVPPNATVHLTFPGVTPATQTVGAGTYHFTR